MIFTALESLCFILSIDALRSLILDDLILKYSKKVGIFFEKCPTSSGQPKLTIQSLRDIFGAIDRAQLVVYYTKTSAP